MIRALKIVFSDIFIVRKLLVSLYLSETVFIGFKTFSPPTLIVIPKKSSKKVLCAVYSFLFSDNLVGVCVKIFNYPLYENEYEQMVIDSTEDIETDYFVITPRLDTSVNGKIPLYLRGFDFAEGTGDHPSTKLILNKLPLFLKQIEDYKTIIIDYGSGSGILSIASKKILPNSWVLSIEIDFQSLNEAKKNYELNKLELFSVCAANPKFINLEKLSFFEKRVFIINVPLFVLSSCFQYFKQEDFYFDFVIISGVKKSNHETLKEFVEKINKEFDNYLDQYDLNYDQLKNWVVVIGRLKI